MSDLILPHKPGHGDAKEVVSAVAKRAIEKMQARILDNRCPICGLRAKIKVVQQEVWVDTPGIVKLIQTAHFKRETWVKCKKCGKSTYDFGPKTKLTTGTKLEEDGLI